MMSLDIVLAALGESAAFETVRPYWSDSMRVLPAGRLPFLDPGALAARRSWGALPKQIEPVLLDVARSIEADEALKRLAWHCLWCLFQCPEPVSYLHWPELRHALGDRAGVFYLLAALDLVPRMRNYHQFIGVPEAVTRETCQQIGCYCLTYQRATGGLPGLHQRQLGWLRHYPREPYFRLGRLEFWLKPYPGGVLAYRDRQTGDTVALAEDGTHFNADGYIDSPPEPDPPRAGWTARLAVTANAVTGCPISPYGMALPRHVTLPMDRWQRVLCKGDPVLQIHIPSGGSMTPEACRDTMQRAVEFFARHFPEQPAAAIVSGSWIFNNQLEDIFPPDANLVRYLSELYLHPVPSGPTGGLWFIFCQDPFDPATAPRETALQRAILDFIEAGSRWRCGGMFMLTDQVKHFGTRYYRAHWPPPILDAK